MPKQLAKKLLFVIPALSDGGAQKQCIYLLNELQEHSHWELHLVLFHKGVHDDQLKHNRLFVHEIPVSSNYDVRALIRLIRLARDIRPDIIMSWLLAADIYSYFVRLAVPSSRWLMTERNSQYPRGSRFCLRRLLGVYADMIVANSEAGRAYWRKYGREERLEVIGNILRPVAKRSRSIETPRRGLYVGRLEPQKNVVSLARAVCLLTSRTDGFDFVFVGDGSERAAVAAVIAEADSSERVRLAGFQRDVDAQLVAADVMVSLSKHEGMPNAMMEAIAAGMPVVASDIPEHRAILGEDYPYYVADPDASEEVAAIIERALQPAPVDALAYPNRVLETMTASSITAKYVSVFESMLRTRR